MRLKYYLRGIAAGVVVSTCILTISHNIEMRSIKNATMTDEEIVEAAKELGMVYEEDVTNLSDQSDREPATTNGDSAMYENSVTTGGDSPYVSDKQVSSNQKQNIEQNKNDTEENKVQTEEDEAKEAESDIKATADEIVDNANRDLEEAFEVEITITNGMSSDKVAKQLKEKGIIEDSDEFDKFMMENGYDNKIWVGDHTISSDDTYEEIANKLIGKE